MPREPFSAPRTDGGVWKLYASLVDVDDRSVQNAQELASIWGEIRTEFEDHEVAVLDSYAILERTTFSSSSTRSTAGRRSNRR